MENRLDPNYYQKIYMDLEKVVAKRTKYKLRDFIELMAGGVTPKVTEQDKYYTDSTNGVPFLRVQNLSPEGLDWSDCKYINKDTHNGLLKRSQVFQGDLLIKITGVGRMAITSIAPEGFEGNINQHIVTVKTKNPELNEQIAAFLNSDVGEMLATHRTTGGTRPALDYVALRSIPIILNDRVPEIMRQAYDEKKRKEKEINALQESINEYILCELGVVMPLKNEKLFANKFFLTSEKQLTLNRFDPEYYADNYQKIISAIEKSPYEKMELSQITEKIFSGTTPKMNDYSEEKTKYAVIKAGSYTKDFINLGLVAYSKKAPLKRARQNDIFILSAAHQSNYVGKSIKFLRDTPDENTGFVGELICVRANQRINPLLLFYILKLDLYKELLNREKRGQTAHIYSKDISKIRVPVPAWEKQMEMNEKIEKIIQETERLEYEGLKIIKSAKLKAEKIFLGRRLDDKKHGVN